MLPGTSVPVVSEGNRMISFPFRIQKHGLCRARTSEYVFTINSAWAADSAHTILLHRINHPFSFNFVMNVYAIWSKNFVIEHSILCFCQSLRLTQPPTSTQGAQEPSGERGEYDVLCEAYVDRAQIGAPAATRAEICSTHAGGYSGLSALEKNLDVTVCTKNKSALIMETCRPVRANPEFCRVAGINGLTLTSRSTDQ